MIVPLNPRSLLTVIVDALEEPGAIAREDGLGAMEKSGPCTMKFPNMVVGWTVQ